MTVLVTAIRRDLSDIPLKDSELIWFTDGSSYIKDGQRKAGAAIVDDTGGGSSGPRLCPLEHPPKKHLCHKH